VSDRLSAWVGTDERSQQWRESLRRQPVPLPILEHGVKVGDVVAVEHDRPMLASSLELHAQRMVAGGHREFLEQSVAVSPGDLDDLAGDVDSFSAGLARFHVWESRT
jgi:hypothetical protein